MEAVQEKSPGYPTQVVPSGARYTELVIPDCTEVFEFRTTELYDPRNCRIPLPPITEEKFNVDVSVGCYYNTTISNIRGMSLTYSMQLEASDHEADEEGGYINMHTKL